jgi:hypothetical protein
MISLIFLVFLAFIILPKLLRMKKNDPFKYGTALGVASIATVPLWMSSEVSSAAAIGAI